MSHIECNQNLSNDSKMYGQIQFSSQSQIIYKLKGYKKSNTGLLHEDSPKSVNYLAVGTHVQTEG